MDDDWDDAAFAALDAIEQEHCNAAQRVPLQQLLHAPPPAPRHLPPQPLQLQPAQRPMPAPQQCWPPPQPHQFPHQAPQPQQPPQQPPPQPQQFPQPHFQQPTQQQPLRSQRQQSFIAAPAVALPSAWAPHPTYRQQLLPGAPPPMEEYLNEGAAMASAAAQAGAAASAAAAAGPSTAELPPRPESQPYDAEAIKTWIFPEMGASERKYQFEISSVAVRHNTLVSLPTGLGKTLIASVVMYNFQRWFPTGRCCFLAPTKPLVHQQVSAVRHSTGLPLAAFAELTGAMKSETRAKAWRESRLLFLTPQTLVNDMQNDICPAHEIVCIVVDEAHKASGNHAYTQAVAMLTRRSGGFRVLALSATPGQTIDRIQEVVTNLRITRMEARDETSIDVMGCA